MHVVKTNPSIHRTPLPILLVSTDRDFGDTTGEILKTEGFNEYRTARLDQVSSSLLASADVVILTEMALTEEQVTLFADHVTNGGNLIAFRPDKRTARLFGLVDVGGTISSAYVRFVTASPIAAGLTDEPLQFHGTADLYRPESGVIVAQLYSTSSTPTAHPAVTFNEYAAGQAVAFTYNLPKSIVLMRQGDWTKAHDKSDGKGVRAADMFAGHVDTSRNHLNQADEQMRLLSHAIEDLAGRRKPLPRFWYFPFARRAVVILTADCCDASKEAPPDKHWDREPTTEERDMLRRPAVAAALIGPQLSAIEAEGARTTLYLQKGHDPPPEVVREWLQAGHEISGHPDNTEFGYDPSFNAEKEKDQPTAASMASRVAERAATIARFGTTMRTVRNHWVTWCGVDGAGNRRFDAQARIEAEYGIEFDCNYYHYDRDPSVGPYLGDVGSFIGSGLPMRFSGFDGDILDVYQSVTQISDEQWGNDNAQLFYNFKLILDRSIDDGAYAYINVNFHPKMNVWPKNLDDIIRIVRYSNDKGTPIWTAVRALEFLKLKDGATFEETAYSNDMLSFDVAPPFVGPGLTFMVPAKYETKRVRSVFLDGVQHEPHVLWIKGREYALVVMPEAARARVTVAYGPRRAIPNPVDWT